MRCPICFEEIEEPRIKCMFTRQVEYTAVLSGNLEYVHALFKKNPRSTSDLTITSFKCPHCETDLAEHMDDKLTDKTRKLIVEFM